MGLRRVGSRCCLAWQHGSALLLQPPLSLALAEPPFTLRTRSPTLLLVPSAKIKSLVNCRMVVGGVGALRPRPQSAATQAVRQLWWIVCCPFWVLAVGVPEVVDRSHVHTLFF